MTTIASMAVATGIRELVRLLSRRPADQNNTNAELEQRYLRAHQAEVEAKEMMEAAKRQADESKRREEEARRREQEANQREQKARQREEEARRRQEEANIAAEQARIAARGANRRDQESKEREEEAKRCEEKASRSAEETRRAALEAQKSEEEVKVRERETKLREEEAKKAAAKAQEQEQQAKKNLERTNFYLSRGIQPEVWPTEEEFRSAKVRIQYDPEKLHFAICGSSGSGKSSLINAFRGIRNFDPGAAPTGVTETTTSITRHPDPHDELPHSRFIWFDVPGAGTPNVPGWQYFNEQGLFIFDIIILVYDARFTQIDVTIIQHCERYRIPLFIVRSKADVQIKNILTDQFDYDEGEEDADEIYKKHHSAARQILIDSTRKNLDKNLEKAKLSKREVFIISSNSMYALMTDKWNRRTIANVIDEANLLQAVLKEAHSRRYGAQAPTKDHLTVVMQNMRMAASQSISNAFGL